MERKDGDRVNAVRYCFKRKKGDNVILVRYCSNLWSLNA